MSLKRVVALAALAAVLTGCATGRTDTPLAVAPRFISDLERPASAAAARPVVALVLGGGGLRGFAHVGVLRALEDAGLRPDIVVGTSAGAVVGAAYASGLTAAQVGQAARSVKVSSLVDWTFSSSGFMRGNNLASWVDTITAGIPIERFSMRFAAVATDLESGQAVLIDRGSPGRAIQASAAVPGMSVPVAYENGHLVDGGVSSLVPVRAARAMGADVVIAVDIYCQGGRAPGLGRSKVMRDVMRAQTCLLAAAEMAEADIQIAPAIVVSGMSATDEHERAIQAGYDAARSALVSFYSVNQAARE